MADGSRHQTSIIAEATPGVTPSTPTFQRLRHKSNSLKLSKGQLQSEEVRSDRQIADFISGAYQVGGSIGGEVSHGTYDYLFECALGGAWSSNVLEVGTNRNYFTVERFFSDIGQYHRFTGCESDGFNLSVSPTGKATIEFPILGRNMGQASTPITGSSYNAETTTRSFDGFSGSIQEGGSPIAIITELSLSLVNGLQPQNVIGSAAVAKNSIGRSNVTGSITAFFEDATLLNKFLSDVESSLEFVLSDGTNTLTFELPRIKYTDADVPTDGEGEILLTLPFQALFDSVEGTNLRMTRSA
jgi:hypothetical protein